MSVLQPGAIIAQRYQVEQRLGAGGMAVVYQCLDREKQRHVAIKLMHEHLLFDQPDLVKRFRREARLMERLCDPTSHPNIVAANEVLEENNLLGIVMELIPDGLGLDTFLEKHGAMVEVDAVRMMEALLSGLAFVHARGIIHRDLKPSNILLVPRGEGLYIPKLADFGIAKDTISGEDDVTSSDPKDSGEQTTLTKTAFGSPAYMSPELFDSATEASPQSDYYALGVCLFEMLLGKPPFIVDSMPAHIMRLTTQPPPSIREVKPDVSEWVDRAIRVSLAQDPAERFQSAQAFREALSGAGMRDPSAVGDIVLETITDDYSVEGVVGRGPVATVFACRDVNLDVPVAVKLLRGFDPGRRERFVAQAQAQSGLHQGRVHRHIAAIRHVIAQDDVHALVLEHVKGEPLDVFLDEHAPDLPSVTRLFVDVADALSHAHGKGVLHRNLKPSNVLVHTPADVPRAKLTDFLMDTISSRGRLDVGRRLGTISYLAPELVDDAVQPTVASDLFALGALLLHALLGTRPPSAAESIERDRDRDRNAAQRAIPALPAQLDRLLMQCLNSDPLKRPLSASDVRDALKEVFRSFEGDAPQQETPRSVWSMLAGVFGLAVVGVVLVFAFSEEPPPTPPPAASAEGPSDEAYNALVQREVFGKYQEEVNGCMVGLLSDREKLEKVLALELPQATVHLSIQLNEVGEIEDIVLVEDTLKDIGLGDCIAERARSWAYPEPGRARVVTKS